MWGTALLTCWALMAPSAPPQRLLIRGPIEPELLTKITAQTVDLALSLQVVPSAPGEQDNLQTDLELAQTHQAQFVLRLQRQAHRGYTLRLSSVLMARAYQHTVQQDQDGASATVTQETVAVLLRGALQALLDTGHLPWKVQEARQGWRLELGLAARGHADGLTVHPGLGLGFQAHRGRWVLGLMATLGLPRRTSIPGVDVSITRHTWMAQGALRLPLAARWGLDLGVQGGVGLRRRRTVQAEAPTTARGPAHQWLGLAGAYTTLHGELGPLRLWLSLGVDLPFGAAEYRLSTPDSTEVLRRAWPVQPWVALGTSLLFWTQP